MAQKFFINKDFSKISLKFFKKITLVVIVFLLFVFFFACFEVYVPTNPDSHETITYTVKKGWGDDDIAKDLQKLGIIRSEDFFRLYVLVSLQHSKLQAGEYNLSPNLSIYQIVKKMAQGDVVKDKIVILEGWDIKDISAYIQSKGICTQDEFIALTQQDYSNKFDFLLDKPKNTGLEGYLFPDTYFFNQQTTPDDAIKAMRSLFDQKITTIQDEIYVFGKATSTDVIMASMLEREATSSVDRRIIAGILWKRLDAKMPLQVDSTLAYALDKPGSKLTSADLAATSSFNTYKNLGMPPTPIGNPGLSAIEDAINPTTTNYWYYISDSNGNIHYARTYDEQLANERKYL